MGNDGLKEGRIGKLSALLVQEARPSTGPHRVEWRYGGDYRQEFERNSQEGEAKSLSYELVLKGLLDT